MKVQLSVLVLVVFIPIACDPLQVDDGLFCMNRIEKSQEPHWGVMSALRNGEPWIVSPSRGVPFAQSNDERETMGIFLHVFDKPSVPGHTCPHEQLYFAGIPRRLGTYPLPGRIVQWDVEQRRYFYTDGYCDVAGEALDYVLDKSEDGFISIDAYDRSSCTISGTFALTVIREGSKGMHPYDDTLQFTEGQFHTHVVTWPGAR